MALDFSKYLGVDVETIEPPTAGPVGHYHAVFQSWKGAERDYDKANGGPKTPVVEVTFKVTSPDTDADEEDSVGAQKVIGKLATKDYTLSEEAGMYGLRKLTSETCGVDTTGMSLEDALNHCKGSPVRIQNNPRPDKKQEGVFYFNITSVLPAQ